MIVDIVIEIKINNYSYIRTGSLLQIIPSQIKQNKGITAESFDTNFYTIYTLQIWDSFVAGTSL